jgi:hydrogenase nickel incorporation protein HypB
MCQECGCSKPGPYKVGEKTVDPHGHAHTHTLPDGTVITHSHDHGHSHGHEHPHTHAHDHDHDHPSSPRSDATGDHVVHPHQVLNLNSGILNANDRAAEQNRGAFKALNLLAINVVSSPGAGKTTLLTKTINELKGRLRCGVIVGDLATDNDAARLRTTGAPVVQIATGTLCHLEAGMVAEAMQQLDLRALDLLIIENVGNLVCPASFDLGEAQRVVLHSVTEGEDKPLKYPPMFHSADAVVVTKTDMAAAAGFDRDLALKNIRQSAPRAKIFELSSRTGDGVKAWCDYLVAQKSAAAAMLK